MHTAARALVCALLVAACDAPPAQLDGDAGPAWSDDAALELDGGAPAVDAGSVQDAGRDAGRAEPVDAGRAELDAGAPDAGEPPACDLYATGAEFCGQCSGSRGCKRTHLDSDPSNVSSGPPACLPSGHILEHNYGYVGQCFNNSDCSCGLFCRGGGACARYCDPEGTPCPDTMQGDPQHCVTEVRGPGGTTVPVPVPYCMIIL